jgi:hypothetical protein
MPPECPPLILVLGYTLLIPVCVMAIVYIFDIVRKYGYIHPVAGLLIVIFAVFTIHSFWQLKRMLF